jgi:hypothetical protein
MRAHPGHRIGLFAAALITFFQPMAISAQEPLTAPVKGAFRTRVPRDGQHDFDFLLGEWKFHLSRLDHPLTGSTKWLEFDGTCICRPVWNGLAQLDEVELAGPTGRIQGLTLRLYNPQSQQWSLNWANRSTGVLGVPTIGSFDAMNGRGEFFDQEVVNGRMILLRYVWSGITPTSAHFEQSFSEDGGKTWEVNWITDQVRVQK